MRPCERESFVFFFFGKALSERHDKGCNGRANIIILLFYVKINTCEREEERIKMTSKIEEKYYSNRIINSYVDTCGICTLQRITSGNVIQCALLLS